MSRFYLSIILLFICSASYSQNELGKYLNYANEQYEKGDYVYALDFYQKAMELDSNSVSTLWKYAETLRAYKDYSKAAFYYEKVYKKEEAGIYPYSLLYWGLMVKQTGNYNEAIELFKRAKKKYAKNKNDYLYLKSKRELESCLWAASEYQDTLRLDDVYLPEELNTVNSEFGHTIFKDTFYFSSLRADSVGENQEIYDPTYTNRLYNYPLKNIGNTQLFQDVNIEQKNTGNGCFSIDGQRYYFSICDGLEGNFQCKIAVIRKTNGQWGEPEVLSEIINEPGTNTTTPFVTKIEGSEWLIFSSNKSKGEGGMDLYFSVMENNGNQFGKVQPFSSLNSPDNEISPFFDTISQNLYFSSQWWDGFGGYDVHKSQLQDGRFQTPVNTGIPINSPANDLYYFQYGDSSFVSSNRLGVLYAKNPTCCSDIFAYSLPRKEVPITKKETLFELNKRLPVTLYFHNDTPDAKSKSPTTQVNYMDSYDDYTALLAEYKKEYSKGLSGTKSSDATEDIESFFIEYVDKGARDLNHFKLLLLEELNKGMRLKVSVKGFASPLAKTDYNVNLTKRRIQSLVNHLMTAENGSFKPYLDGTALNGGQLEIVAVPFGEYTANQITSDNPNDLKNSIYSKAAAIERKIEIQSVSYMESDSLFFLVDLSPTSIVLGKRSFNKPTSSELSIFNNGANTLKIIKTESKDSLFSVKVPIYVPSNYPVLIDIQSAKDLPIGIFSSVLLLYFEGYEKPIQVMILGEGM